MSNGLYFVISAVVLSFTMLASFYLKYRIPTKDNKLLLLMIWMITLSSVIDLALGMNGIYYQLQRKVSLALKTLYVLIQQFIIVSYAVYIIITTEQKIGKWTKLVLGLLNVYGLVLIVMNIKCQWLFGIDEQGYYVRSEQVYLYYIVAIVYLLFSLQHLLRFGKVVEWSKKISLYMFIILPYLCAWLQYEIPGFFIESFGMTISLLWIYLSAPRMDRMMDSETGVMNQYAFSKKIVQMLENKQNSFIMVMRFRDKSSMQSKYGLETYKKLMRETSCLLCDKAGRERVYYLQDGRFAVEVLKTEEKDAKGEADEILKILRKTWKIYGRDIEVWAVGALLVLPSDVKNINDVYNYLEYLEIMPSLKNGSTYEGRHLDIAYMRRYDEIERAIDRALIQTSFDVYYQPIYSTKEKRIVAAEALLRMYDEEMGFVSPDEFIPIAEKNGKIIEIGHLVLEKVCQFLQKEDIRKYGIHYIEVNLSIIECIQKELPQRIEELMKKYKVDCTQINLEITETALAQNHEILAANMKKINEMGVTFSLDDYGTGYSTITYMMTLPFKIVKIDKSILWSSFQNEKAMIALCASINMIKDMDMEIVVEGVESEEMATKLAELGCDYLQGFYFSKPLPEKQFKEYLTKSM
ncbi:MAG: EAL domain-containing protein [Lachnospiraceae bacterium]|nr:EAL domain-containing protein [Lachnospiraceae bacterium]